MAKRKSTRRKSTRRKRARTKKVKAAVPKVKRLRLDGTSLSLDRLAPLVRGEDLHLTVSAGARALVKEARALVDELVEEGEVVYGVTTGFGKLKDVAVPSEDLVELQRNLVLSHCCGVGEPMPREEVRIAQVLRLNGLLRGHSGVRPQTIDKLVRLFNAGFVPEVPRQGSVGASGDLAPLSHMAAAYMGHGRAELGGRSMTAKAALKKLDEEPLVLHAKEGLALINGTEIMKAIGVVACSRARSLSKLSDAIAALSIEALFGSVTPFDERLAELKADPGHERTASNVRACLKRSEVLKSHTDCDRVQDPYSLRCVPQIHGAAKNAIAHVGAVLERELNGVTDNPILFPETAEVVSAGMFHGQPISMVMDYLGLALATLANVSERRVEQLVNPDLSDLPAFLAPKPGLHSGYMIAQVAAAALASENKVHAHPASVDTVPTSANQEDHVSMGVTAARKARTILENTEQVLAIELLCAGQGREFHPELRAGKGAQALHEHLREHVAPLFRDRYAHTDLQAACEIVRDGSALAAVERKAGRLES
ncbi:MAG: histidine ammonia-lyase [Planctomycetes bacterium]|nr:histidine ammonia-lyase [Planctomycetota bacterium]